MTLAVVLMPFLALLVAVAAPASVLGEHCDSSCRWRPDHVGFIEPGSHTSWGEWGFMEHCPDGFYASGYVLQQSLGRKQSFPTSKGGVQNGKLS